MQMVIRKYGNLIDISPDGRQPTPPQIIELLTPSMTYIYKEVLRGAEAYDAATGDRHRVRLETRKLWQLSTDGKLTTGAGYLTSIVGMLTRAGYDPRFVDISPPHQRTTRYDADWANLHKYITFRPRQEECVQRIVANYGGIIKAVTGFGKTTLIAAMALLFPKAKIHIIVRPIDVAERIVRDLTRFIPDVGQVGGGKKRWRRVTVVTADSLHLSDGDADFLFCDEVHQLVAPTYAEPLSHLYRWSRNYGFSATPYGRNDGAQARLECLFGPMIFELTYEEAVRLGLVVPMRVHWLQMRMDNNPAANKTTDLSRKRWGIWRNMERNYAFAKYIEDTYQPDVQVLTLVESIEHAVNMLQVMPHAVLAYGMMKPDDFANYVRSKQLPANFPEMTAARRVALREGFERGEIKRAIATDVWATGVDFQRLQVVVRADDRDSEILSAQGPGRGSRLFTDEQGVSKLYAETIDSIDYFDKSFLAKSRGRYRAYKELGWDQDWPQGRRQIARTSGPQR